MFSRASHYRLKSAQRDLIDMSGGIQKTADKVSVSKSQIGRCHDMEAPDLLAMNVVLALEHECGVPVVTSVMAQINGRRVSDGEGSAEDGANVLARHSDAVLQAAELMASGAAAFADGKVTPAEAAQMDRVASQLEKLLGPLRLALAKVKADGSEVIQFNAAGD